MAVIDVIIVYEIQESESNMRFNTLILFMLFAFEANSQDFQYLPASLVQMDSFFSHHVMVAEKSSNTFFLFENDKGTPKLIKSYPMATGKMSGDKISQGDFRTPEGVYNLLKFIPNEKLLDMYGQEIGQIYGVGAFVMDYPNVIDSRKGKTGSGIWLHSTNDETRIDKGQDSRGCVVIANNELKDISKYIELNKTPIVVVHDLNYLSQKAWSRRKDELVSFIETWAQAWRDEDLEKYIDHYDPKEFSNTYRGNYKQFKNYKQAVFSGPGKPEIGISDISILGASDYITVTLKQKYKSNTIDDIGKKTLHLKRDEFYNWKIVAEDFMRLTKEEIENPIVFRPSMRFFLENDETRPEQKSN
ncbi:MAG: L,D-transpeptidase family protein [Halobacteriovoraceae bacterium]|nr:L,D-transpeptidase family protein [Halobacteriovoraceae bacterium]